MLLQFNILSLIAMRTYHNLLFLFILFFVSSCSQDSTDVVYTNYGIKDMRCFLKGKWMLTDKTTNDDQLKSVYTFDFQTDSSGFLNEFLLNQEKHTHIIVSCPPFFTFSKKGRFMYLIFRPMFPDPTAKPEKIQAITSQKIITITADSKVTTYIKYSD